MWLSLMKPTTLRPVNLSISPTHLGLHDHLPAFAEIEHGLPFPGIRECLLTDRQGVLQDDEDGVGAERRLRLGRPSPGRTGECLDH